MKETTAKQSINTLLQQLLAFCKKHAIVICLALSACLAGYILLLTNELTTAQPDQTSIESQLNSVPKPKIDESVAKTIEGLEDRNIEIKTIFQEARENPFNE